MILPIPLQDCDIPLFLRGKLYADFRTDFDKGLKAMLEAVARLTSDSLGRVDQPHWHMDWSVDWGTVDKQFFIKLTLIEQTEEQPYSLLTEIQILADETATERYRLFAEQGLDWVERAAIIEMLADGTHDNDLRLLLEDQTAKTQDIT